MFHFFIWEGLGDPQETEASTLVLMMLCSVCVIKSLGHLVTIYSLDILLFLFGISLLFHVQF